jgi:hypothetical protein
VFAGTDWGAKEFGCDIWCVLGGSRLMMGTHEVGVERTAGPTCYCDFNHIALVSSNPKFGSSLKLSKLHSMRITSVYNSGEPSPPGE